MNVLTSATSTTKPVALLIATARCPVGVVAAETAAQLVAAFRFDLSQAADEDGDHERCNEVVEIHPEMDYGGVNDCCKLVGSLFVFRGSALVIVSI